jgi:dolichyl-phosphate-mannose-protein mannosyltransferase
MVHSMTPRISTATLAAAIVLGAVLRATVLPVRVPPVDESWRAWSAHAATEGPARMYGPRGHTVHFGDLDVPVVYPPLALAEFAVIGRAYQLATRGPIADDTRLVVAIKTTIVVFELALTAAIFAALRRTAGADAARAGAAAYWANPAALVATSLGYVDAFVALPATGAIVAASSQRPRWAGVLLAAAVMTKPQAMLIAPAVGLAVWNAGDSTGARLRIISAALAAAATGILIVVPLMAAGTLYYMLRSVAVLAGHDMLSAWAFNAWWFVSYLFAAAAAAADGFRAALSAPTAMVTHAAAIERGFPHPRIVAAAVVAGAAAWGLIRARRTTDLGAHAALAAFLVVAYFVLSVQVHENHFFLALPLLALAAALRPELAPVFAAFSVTFALNLYLVYGWAGHAPSTQVLPAVGIDATVIVSLVNCALFAWFAATFARLCRGGNGALASR